MGGLMQKCAKTFFKIGFGETDVPGDEARKQLFRTLICNFCAAELFALHVPGLSCNLFSVVYVRTEPRFCGDDY